MGNIKSTTYKRGVYMGEEEEKEEEVFSPNEDLARSFEYWQKEYYDGVAIYFSKQNKERGMIAFELWEQRFLEFLAKSANSLLPIYNNNVKRKSVNSYFDESVYRSWKKGKGNAIEALLTEAIISARDGRLENVKVDVNESITHLSDNSKLSNNRVFLVHGHDEAVIHETARFLGKLMLDVKILREQPNSGRTIIEKFIDHSDVAYAVVLLTGDDRGGKANDKFEDQKLRARQNVILELGFFLGKLERKRVCVLYQDGVDIPSDYNGVLFIPLDKNGAWRFQLARELKVAGLNIDMNNAV